MAHGAFTIAQVRDQIPALILLSTIFVPLGYPHPIQVPDLGPNRNTNKNLCIKVL